MFKFAAVNIVISTMLSNVKADLLQRNTVLVGVSAIASL